MDVKTSNAYEKVALFWDPEGFALDVFGGKQILGLSDDDTPEAHYPGIHQTRPAELLTSKLETGKAFGRGIDPLTKRCRS